METQVQSDSRIFQPGSAGRRRTAARCAPAGRRGAGSGLAAAPGHVPSAPAQPPPLPPLPCSAAPPPNPNSHQEEGAAPPPHPAPAAGGSGAASSPPPRGPGRAPAPAAPGGASPRPAPGGGHGRGSTDGGRRRALAAPTASGSGGKGLLRCAISISLKGPVPPGPRVAICISIGGSRRSAGAPSPSAAPRDVNPSGRGVWPRVSRAGTGPPPPACPAHRAASAPGWVRGHRREERGWRAVSGTAPEPYYSAVSTTVLKDFLWMPCDRAAPGTRGKGCARETMTMMGAKCCQKL